MLPDLAKMSSLSTPSSGNIMSKRYVSNSVYIYILTTDYVNYPNCVIKGHPMFPAFPCPLVVSTMNECHTRNYTIGHRLDHICFT